MYFTLNLNKRVKYDALRGKREVQRNGGGGGKKKDIVKVAGKYKF